MHKTWLSTFVIVLMAVTCNKDNAEIDQYITLSYKQTYCADPWQTATTDELTLKNVADYLNGADLYLAGLNIKQDSTPDVCNACSCKTGKTIYVSTLNSETLIKKYLQIGFK